MGNNQLLEMHRAWAKRGNPLAAGGANAEELAALKKTNSEMAKRIAEFTEQTEKMSKDVADLEAQVAQRDQRIASLQADVDALTKQLEEAGNGSADAQAKRIVELEKFCQKAREYWHGVTVEGKDPEASFSDLMDDLDAVYPATAVDGNGTGSKRKGGKRTRKGN